jgi:hypothetical protein
MVHYFTPLHYYFNFNLHFLHPIISFTLHHIISFILNLILHYLFHFPNLINYLIINLKSFQYFVHLHQHNFKPFL